MTPERWQKVKEVFQAAMDYDARERSAFVAAACSGDELLRTEVESLLAAHQKNGSFIDSPAFAAATELLMIAPELKVGQTFSHYEIISTIGRGGMGEVYLARDTLLDRQVALKVLPSFFNQDPDRLRRFEREARAGSALNHPNILTIHEIGRIGENHFIATEFVEGKTLRDRITSGPLPIREALSVTDQIAAALFAAHAKGILHRDIKPENVMLRTDGLIKVLDFGLAKLIQQSPSAGSRGALIHTSPGIVIGTVAYMSPEQTRGERVDAGADIWSLGVVLFEMLTGRLPFSGLTGSDVMAAVLEREPPPLKDYLRQVPEELEQIVQKMLRKDREDRYQTIAELQHDLAALKSILFQGDSPIEKTVTIKAEKTDSDRRYTKPAALRFWRPLPVLVTVAVLGALVFGIYKFIVPKIFHRQPVANAPKQRSILRTRQVTSWNGLDLGPSFSPDGNAIAYSSDQSGTIEIYVKPLADGGREIQITADDQQNLQPAWSPDGKLIAYHSKKRGGVWLVPALGGVARQLTDFGSYPAWSPDGSMIAFQSAGIGDGLLAIGSGAVTSSTIWSVNTTGGTPKQISHPKDISGSHGSPAWSPDGKSIAFTKFDLARQPEIWSVSADGSQPKLVVQNGVEPVYSPGGESIYFIGNPSNLGYGVWQILVSPDQNSNKEPFKVMDAGSVSIKHLSLTDDGQRIAYSALSQASNLWSVPLSSSGETAGPPKALTRELNYRTSAPAVSPDGEKILYTVYRGGGPAGIWMINANGSNPGQMTTENGLGPTWSHDGGQIFYALQSEGRGSIWSLPVKGGKAQRLIELEAGSNFLRISPDGKHVAFNLTKSGAMNLWVASVVDGALKQLTFDQEGMGFASWSPDGKVITLGMRRGDDTHVGVVPSSGGEVVQLTSEAGTNLPGSFSPDGDKIAFVAGRDGIWNIYWVSRSTRQKKQLTNYTKLNALVRYPAWSPLGNQIVYEYNETTSNIWLMELK